MNPQTSMALREDVIQRTVYVSDIDQQLFRLLTVSSHSEWKVMCFLDSRVRTSPVFGSQAEDEHEMRARTIYYTNIDTKAACGEVYRLRLLGDYHHPTRISFVEFVMAESAVTTLNCSGVLLGSLQIRVFPFPQSENMNLDDRGGKAWSCGGDASLRWRCEHRCAEVFMGVANTSIILRDDKFLKYLKDHQKNFRFERM
ncbi:hypothetical protein F2Q69_00030641 [Brassica cretica]|uniref:RRM domain-containing protein n=1 Tax=Brassica cretica TaxID=69181 RepID=A0A8S9RUF8_BRACR|nr:hypothetical protein F2Q69_00030641 [Brassica cretica]